MAINVEYNLKEINQIVMENTLKMLERRKLINSWSNEYKKFGSNIDNNNIFELTLNDKSSCSIYLVNAKLSSIIQGTPLDEYLSNHLEVHKIIIAKDVAKKVVKQIVNDFKNAEFFFENEMLEDIPSKDFIPLHEIISKEERDELMEYRIETEFSRIYLTDMMARYYGAKIGDIMRITRPNCIEYRRVINGSWDILFDE